MSKKPNEAEEVALGVPTDAAVQEHTRIIEVRSQRRTVRQP